jgi:hypothetical protein
MTEGKENTLWVDTARVVLVPAPMYEKGSEEHFLRFGGIALAEGEVALASEPSDGVVAVVAIEAEVWNRHKDRYQRGELSVSSPLLCAIAGAEGGRRDRRVNILLGQGNLYLAVWDGALRMAEALPENSVASVLYYMQVVGRSFELRRFEIFVNGEGADAVAEALRRYYKKVRVT